MIFSDNDHELKWLWIDGKKHTVKITAGEEELNITEILKTAKKVTEDNKDMCKAIAYLGVGITGSAEGAQGFLMGWLLRSLKQTQETDHKWNIQHDEELVDDEEAREHTIHMLEGLIEKMRDTNISKKDMPVVRGDNNGATDLF